MSQISANSNIPMPRARLFRHLC